MAVVGLLVLATLVPTAAASELSDEGGAGAPVSKSSQRLDRPPVRVHHVGGSANSGGSGTPLWSWVKGQRLFMLDYRDSRQGFEEIVSFDANTFQETTRAKLPHQALGLQPARNGVYQGLAVDEEQGRLFVAYMAPVIVGTPPLSSTTNTAGHGKVCLSPTDPCVAGIDILDANTLAPLASVSLPSVRLDAAVTAPRLMAMTFVRTPEGHSKLVLVIEEAFLPATSEQADPKRNTQTTHYAVQIDADSASVDWTYQLQACNQVREHKQGGQDSAAAWLRPHPAAVMLQASEENRYVVVGCHSGAQVATIVRVPLDEDYRPSPLPVRPGNPAMVAPEAESPRLDGVATVSEQVWTFFGPERTYEYLADPPSGRLLMRVLDGTPQAEVWWVFDSGSWQMVGTIGIGASGIKKSIAGLDPVKGRLYVFMAAGDNRRPGLYAADVRTTPLGQALYFAEFGDVTNAGEFVDLALVAHAGGGIDGPTKLFIPAWSASETVFNGFKSTGYSVLTDARAGTVEVALDESYAGRTLDLEEIDGVTATSLDAAARGYGLRVLLVGGGEAAARVGPADPVGAAMASQQFLDTLGDASFRQNLNPVRGQGFPFRSPCTEGNRDIVLGFVGPSGAAVVDGSGARGAAEPVVVDSATRADSEAPMSRCATRDWQELWGTALFGSAPTDEPTAPRMFSNTLAQCVSSGRQMSSDTGDPVLGSYAAGVECADNEASGFAYARGTQIGDVSVGQAMSSFRIYRDPGRGIVSRVESVTRGLNIPGVLRIDTVRGVGESWANGRRFTPPEMEEGQSYNPNCDLERTAGTCFRRYILGVWTPGYSCGPCGDEATMATRISRGMGQYGAVALRNPDPDLARGADNGFIAAITKRDSERFADLVLNNDLLQTVLPTLEILRYTSPNRPLTGGGPRGRQIIQLAGVEVSSSYGIQCLLVYDETSNTCAAAAEPPGSITVSLADGEGRPLAGGAFEVRADVDADGVLGLKDALLPNGACVTADDGVGTCRFEDLAPGPYVVSQVAAPPGYGTSAEPFVVELASGEARTVAFTNVSSLSAIELQATDEAGAPLVGASFAAYPDPDSDGKVAPDTKPAAECTTDAQGVCRMRVPAGSYVLVQTSAPGGLEGIEPVPFTFASGGQVAAVTVVNYPPDAPQAPTAAPEPPVYSAPVDVAPPVESIDPYTPPVDEPIPPEAAPDEGIVDQVGGTVVQAIRAPGDALRLVSRDPKQAVAWTAAIALFCLAALAVRRRQQAATLIDG